MIRKPLQINLTITEKQVLQNEAKQRGLTLSSFIRMAAIKEVKQSALTSTTIIKEARK